MKLSAQISLFSSVKFIDKLLFTKHLSMMSASSITILEALEILASQTESQALKKVLLAMVADIKNGKSLNSAMSKHPKAFDPFYVSIIEVGETSGTLSKSLTYLSDQLAKEYLFRKKVRGALMYPVIVLTAAGLVGGGISVFVLPQLINLFKGFDVQLPLTTQLLLGFAGIMQQYGILVILGAAVALFALHFIIKQRQVKPYIDRMMFAVPVFGKIIQDSQLAAFCRNLGVMLQTGLPITSGLAIEVKITSNSVYQLYMLQLLAAVEKGKSISEELESGHYSKIPLIVTKMISVGERTGRLDETLIYLSNFFEDEVDDATSNISTLLEPIMLFLIGGIVAFVALAIISPIYQLTGSIK